MVTINKTTIYLKVYMTRLKRKFKYNSGFTLVELLISASILVVAVAAVAVIISRGSKINREDMLRRRAYQVMEEILERSDLSWRNYPNLLNRIGTDKTFLVENLPDDTLYNIGESQPITAQVQRRLDKRLLASGTNTQIPCIEVTVTLTYGTNTEKLSTIVAGRP